MRALLLASGLVVAGGSLAAADDTFEAKASGAVRVAQIDDLVWALTTPCDKGDDTQQRQCRRLRDTRAAQLANATLILDADRDAFAFGAWSPQKKSAPMTLSACIKCSGVKVDGQTWFVVGSKEGNPAPRFEGGKLKAGMLYENARTFPDEASARKFAAGAAGAKVQLIVKVPPKAKWTDAGKHGLSLDVLGYRVFSPCDGSVVVSSPKAAGGEVDKKACAQMTAKAAGQAAEAGALTPAQIKAAVKPVVEGAKDCYAKFKVAGKGKLRMAIAGDGSLAEYEQQGDFANTPTGACIDAAMKGVSFPASTKDRTPVTVPISLP